MAYYTDTADGGEPDIHFTPAAKPLETQMEASAVQFGKKYAERYWADMLDGDFEKLLATIVEDIYNLNSLEKSYKSAMKKNGGKEVMFILPVFAIDNYKNRTGSVYYPCDSTSDEDKNGIIKQMQKKYPDSIGYDIYKSLKCFNIN